jgi:hypothetical protein
MSTLRGRGGLSLTSGCGRQTLRWPGRLSGIATLVIALCTGLGAQEDKKSATDDGPRNLGVILERASQGVVLEASDDRLAIAALTRWS